MAERIFLYIYLTLFVANAAFAHGDITPLPPKFPYQPAISIIIDDLGEQFESGMKAVDLPGQVTLAFLPYTPYATTLAARAHEIDKEIMLHMPMEAIEPHNLGKGGLTKEMHQKEFVKAIEDALASIPYVAGLNNHMGSLLTQEHKHMLWLMQEINHHGNLFFVDSRTITGSVAQHVAMENHIPNLRRDVFLDDDRNPAAIRAQFDELIALAKSKGTALAIGHPYPQTLSFLQRRLSHLKKSGVELISSSELIKRTAFINASRSTESMVASSPETSDTINATTQ
jgi:polysaccharide deacetylase 2 family uncharacterized protein YibQ